MARYYDAEYGRFLAVDPLAEKAPNWSPFRAYFDNPISVIDPKGLFEFEAQKTTHMDGWFKDITGRVLFDSRINSQTDLVKNGINGEFLGSNKFDKKVLDAIGQDIMAEKGGLKKFLQYFECNDLGKSYFFAAAYQNYDDNSTGLMVHVSSLNPLIVPAIRISQMTHEWVNREGWTEVRNELEHFIGMFILSDIGGADLAEAIGWGNDLRGWLVQDRQNGNMINALEGGQGTAFEWSDLKNNSNGVWLWRLYNNGTIKLSE